MIENVCNIKTGNKNTQDKKENGVYPFFVRSSIIERINSYTFDGEAVLTAGDGVGVGKVFHYSQGKIGVHQRVYILSNFTCFGKYLYYYFSSNFYNRVKRMSAKNSVDSVRYDMIAKMSFLLPSRKEQEKIVALLSLIDERIVAQNKIIEKLESLIKGLNNYLHSECEEIISLSDLGYSYSGLSGKTADDFGDGKPYITYLNVYQNNVINNKNLGYVRIEEYENQNLVKYGDALFTLSSETPKEVGIASVCLAEINNTYLNSFCFGYRLSDFNTLLPQYMPFCFSSERFRRFILPFAQGSTRYNLQKSDFMKAKFLIPNITRQKLIANLLAAMTNKLQGDKDLFKIYSLKKNYLLQNLFI